MEAQCLLELKTKHSPFDQNNSIIPISDSKTSTTFPEGAEKPGNPAGPLLNSTGIPSPWDSHSKSFSLDKELVKPRLLLPSPFLSPGIPHALSWNSDPRDLGGWKNVVTLLIHWHHPTHPDGMLILVFILFLQTLPSFVSSLHPQGFIPKLPKL